MLPVMIYRNPSFVSYTEIIRLTTALPQIVAEALDAPEEIDGGLVPEDIEVKVHNSSLPDVNIHPLEIFIWAGDLPARRINLDERREKIIQGVVAHKGAKTSGFVWILLAPVSFGEFAGKKDVSECEVHSSVEHM